VTALSYVDRSAEPRDQVAEHALMAFADSLRAELATSGKFRITSLDCRASPCSASDSALARRRGQGGRRRI
jgi:hypothetical protein